MGEHLPNLFYLDETWTRNNIDLILPIGKYQIWELVFSTYLISVGRIFEPLYLLLREKGHFAKAIDLEFEIDGVDEKLGQQITVGYLGNLEDLGTPSSLISLLLKKNRPRQINAIVKFLWSPREKPSAAFRAKIKPLWRKIFEEALPNENSLDYQRILSDLGLWLWLIEDIDEDIFAWLKVSSKYIRVNYHETFFIEYLLEHSARQPRYVGLLYLEMISSGTYPDYKKEDIRGIVEALFEKGKKRQCQTDLQFVWCKGF